jgi:hypothetical protein
MDPNEAISYARQLETEASAIFSRVIGDGISGDEAVEMGRKLYEATQLRRSLGQIGDLGDGTCEMLLDAGQFAGEDNPTLPLDGYQIEDDALVKIVNGTVYDGSHAIGSKVFVEQLPSGGSRVVYRPRFGGLVERLQDDEARVELDRKTRWLAAFSTAQRTAVLRELARYQKSVRDVTAWTVADDSGRAVVEAGAGLSIAVWPDGRAMPVSAGWQGA